jgi:hypothetical protein
MYGLEGIMRYWFWMEVDGFWWIDLLSAAERRCRDDGALM